MTFDITKFKSAMTSGGARPSLFEVSLAFPAIDATIPTDDGAAARTSSLETRFKIKATSIPSSTVSPIEVPYFGRKVKFAGNRTFPEWTITVINDEDFDLRAQFEAWLAAINTHKTNQQKYVRPDNYMIDATVTQYGKGGPTEVLRKYTFVRCFPSEVSPIELNWSSENEIEEFTVTLQYDYWVATDT